MKNTTLELTHDMVETLAEYFEAFQTDGVIQVICNPMGLWFVIPGSRNPKFIGKAKLTETPPPFKQVQH